LKTLGLLDLRTSLSEESQPSPTKDHRQSEPSRLDEVFRRLQQPGPKSSELLIVIEGLLAGRVQADKNGRLSLSLHSRA